MQDMSDKEFDEIFKKAADQYQIPYNQRAWDKMRTKLDRGGSAMIHTGRKIIFSLVLLLLLGIAGMWIFLDKNDPLTATKSQPETQQSEDAGNGNSSVASDARETLSFRKEKNSPAQGSSRISNAQTSKAASSIQQTDREGISSVSSTPTPTVNETNSSSSFDKEGDSTHMNVIIQPYETHLFGYMAARGWSSLSVPWASSSMTIPIGQPVKEQGVQEVIKNKKDKTVSPFHRWALSFSVSPDLSAIQLADISQVGMKSGVGLEFFLFRNLSLQTGLVFSHKVYSATEGYQAPNGYWYYNKQPTKIDATCDVLDIPVNLRFYAFQWGKNRLFVSAGLSSYLMLKEEYQYQYYSYNPKQLTSHQARNKNQHYFKVSNFSLGYERSLGRLWALQAEPFIKSPMAGVGEGKVKLSTAGIFMTIKYNIGMIPSGN